MSENPTSNLNVVSVSGWLHEVFEEIGDGVKAEGYGFIHLRDPRALGQPGVLAEADVLLAASAVPVTRAVMETACAASRASAPLNAAPRLRAVVCPFIGAEGFDLAAASELGILVVNGQVAENAQSMSEATILLMLAALYDLHESERLFRESLPHPQVTSSHMLRGKTVGLIGFGRIAQGVARRLAGWDVRIQAYDPHRAEAFPEGVSGVGLEELLHSSDVVCVLAALTNETRGLLDGARLRTMKPEAVLVNTARGGIIDEAALVEVAAERPGLRVAIDTFAVEPLPAESPLRRLPNAILTPHLVGHTRESMAAIPGVAVENILCVLRGEAPGSTLNPGIAAEWEKRFKR